MAEKIIKNDNKDSEVIWDLSLIAIIFGILGARSYYVIDHWDYYSQDIKQILYIWQGGLGIYGAIILGFLAIYIYLKIKKLDISYYLSIITTVLPLGQAIGRWGNYFNKEIYGIETTLPWAISINNKKYHPLFLYESILNLILVSILLKIRKKVSNKKTIAFYIGGYSFIRFSLEFLKENQNKLFYLSNAQIISVIFLIISFIIISKKDPVQ